MEKRKKQATGGFGAEWWFFTALLARQRAVDSWQAAECRADKVNFAGLTKNSGSVKPLSFFDTF